MVDVKLNELIFESQSVLTQMCTNTSWLDNNILEIKDDIVTLGFNPEYLKLLITVGDSIRIKARNNEKEFILIGLIENIVLCDPYKVIVKVENVIFFHNSRKHDRYNINLFCKIIPPYDGIKILGITTDISKCGLSIVTYADIGVIDSAEVEVITLDNRLIKFVGKVRRLQAEKSNHILYGVEIIEIDEANRILLDKIVESAK